MNTRSPRLFSSMVRRVGLKSIIWKVRNVDNIFYACAIFYTRSFVRSYVRTFARLFVRSFMRTFVRSFVRSFVRFFCSLIHCIVFIQRAPLISWSSISQSCLRVGWTRRVGSGRVTIMPEFGGSGRVSTSDFSVFTDYSVVPKSVWIFEYYIRIDWFAMIFNI